MCHSEFYKSWTIKLFFFVLGVTCVTLGELSIDSQIVKLFLGVTFGVTFRCDMSH
jgi:hypothetical protein